MTTYTNLLGLALPVTGQLSGTWGDTVNDYITQYIDAAVAGAVTVNADTTLNKTTGSALGATSSQYAMIIASGHSTNITVTAPATSKAYLVINKSSTYTVKIRGAGPTTGVTIPVNNSALVAWNGTDFVVIAGDLIGVSNSASPFETSLGYQAGNVNTGVDNVFIGYSAGAVNTSGTYNTVIGSSTYSGSTGSNNTVVGYLSATSITSGSNNVAVGTGIMQLNSTGAYNVAVGNDALANTTGGSATAIGHAALGKVSTGFGNTGLGFFAGTRINTGAYNTALGGESGSYVTTGSYNTIVGFQSGASGVGNLTTGSNNIFIGTQTIASASSVSSEIIIGNNLTGKGTQTAFIGGTNGAYNAKNVTTWETTSDERIKRNIVDSPKGLAEVKQLRVRNFNYKQVEDMPLNEEGKPIIDNLDPNKRITGFIAQELQTVMPECVNTTASGLLSVSSDPVIYALVKAVQELAAEVEALKARL
jgi:hypothetical protein